MFNDTATPFKCLHSLVVPHSRQMVQGQGLAVPLSLPLILAVQVTFRYPNLVAHHLHLVTPDPLQMAPQMLVDPRPLQGLEECTLTD